MKRVIFKRVAIQNFLSIGQEPVVIDFKHGLNLITGINRDKPDRKNAAGKSAVICGIYFAIFGETLRDIKRELIPNNLTGGTAHVELDFDVEVPNSTISYKIVRNLQPSRVQLFENGIDITRDSIQNTSKQICDVLSATPAIFRNCVIMDINSATPFMAKSKTDKRKFIEDIFGMEIFSQMLSILRQEYNATKREADIANGKVEEVEKTSLRYVQQKETALARKVEKRELYASRQRDNIKRKEELEQQLANIETIDTNEIDKQKADLEQSQITCDGKAIQYASQISSLQTQVKHLENTFKQIGTKDSKCPVCLKAVTDHDRDLIEAEKESIKQQIATIKQEISDQQQKEKKLKDIKETIRTKIQNLNKALNKALALESKSREIRSNLNQIEKWQEELVVDISSVQDDTTEFDQLISDTQARIDELQKQTDEFQRELSKLDIVKFVISEEGVKSYIVNKLLELLNSLMVTYLKRLDANSICIFNEYFEEEITNENNKVCSYFNFSGAERKAIDLACLFTFADIRRMQGGVSYNLAIYDELFDSSFDERGIELIIEILKERVYKFDECNLVISHRKESLKSADGEIICLEKENGITRRVEYQE